MPAKSMLSGKARLAIEVGGLTVAAIALGAAIYFGHTRRAREGAVSLLHGR